METKGCLSKPARSLDDPGRSMPAIDMLVIKGVCTAEHTPVGEV